MNNLLFEIMREQDIPFLYTPHSWYREIKRPNGKPDQTAISVLSDILSRFEPQYQFDDQGDIVGMEWPLKSSGIICEYEHIAHGMNFSLSDVKNAMDRLVEKGILRRSFYKKNGRLPMMIEIVPERFKAITRFKNDIT
jgi:hypothetical protein